MRFEDRASAGRRLAALLMGHRDSSPVVLALPRGGIEVAVPIATALDCPLDVLVVRKLGAPLQPELGMGAIAEDGTLLLDEDVVRIVLASEAEIAEATRRERVELAQGLVRYRAGRALARCDGRTVIVVDDGVATGVTARAALRAVRHLGARRVVFATPVGARPALEQLAREASEVVCPLPVDDLNAIGEWYDDFAQTSDERVLELLDGVTRHLAAAHAINPPRRATGVDVQIAAAGIDEPLCGVLEVPPDATGLVILANGSGSARHSPRSRAVAYALRQADIATLLVDLFSEEEEAEEVIAGVGWRHDIRSLAERVRAVVEWVRTQSATSQLSVGLMGAGAGAAAVLLTAAGLPDVVDAVVTRGGRPDLAGDALPAVRAPTLLIIGSRDTALLDLNSSAYGALRCDKQIAIVPGATPQFSEPGTLEHAAHLSVDWFVSHLGAQHDRAVIR